MIHRMSIRSLAVVLTWCLSAELAEVHHPDYLNVADLQRIYGAVVNDASYGVAREQPELALIRDKMN